MHLHAVLAVAVVAPAHAAAQRLEIDVGRAAARVDAGEHYAGVGAVSGTDGLLGQHVGQRADETSITRWQVLARNATAAGATQLATLPTGATISTASMAA